jgi:hypothetical protein
MKVFGKIFSLDQSDLEHAKKYSKINGSNYSFFQHFSTFFLFFLRMVVFLTLYVTWYKVHLKLEILI